MKKVLIRLTGLLVTTAIAISGNGLVLATEVEGTGNETGTATEATAEEPKVEETSAAEETEAPSQEEKSSEETAATEPASETEKVVTVEEKIPGVKRSNISTSSPNNINNNYIFDAYNQDTYTGYKIIRQQLSNILGGSRTSTKFEIQTSQLSANYTNFSPSELGVKPSAFNSQNTIRIQNEDAWDTVKDYISFSTITAGLLNACPLDMFWYQGALHSNGADNYSHPGLDVAFVCSYDSVNKKVTIHTIIFEFKVASAFKGANDYTISSDAIAMAKTAKANADAIINLNKNKSDIDKLIAYKNAIANSATFFDTDSAGEGGGIEWQMIPVFDNDSSTSAVSDGYAKAFQYLCDNTTFKNSNIFAITAFGLGWTGYHTWNIVHMDDGKNYIVDIFLEKDQKNSAYFLGGATYSENERAYKIVGGDAGYTFSGDTLDFYSEYTVYSTTKYAIGDEPEPEEAPKFVAHAMRLRDNIGLSFYIEFPEDFDPTNCYVTFSSYDGRTGTVSYEESVSVGNNQRDFTFFISPLGLSDNVTATLHYGNNKIVTSEPYSAYDYIVAARSYYASYPKVVNLINSLHAYGYYLQKSGWGDKRSHGTIPDPVKALSADEIAAAKTAINAFSIEKNIGTSGVDEKIMTDVSIATTTELRLYVTATEGTTIIAPGANTAVFYNKTYYQFSTGRIGPKALGTPRTVTVTTNKGTATFKTSTMYYVKSAMINSNLTDNQTKALVALYYYYKASEAYN